MSAPFAPPRGPVRKRALLIAAALLLLWLTAMAVLGRQTLTNLVVAGQPLPAAAANVGQPPPAVDPNAGQPPPAADPNVGQPPPAADPNVGQPPPAVNPNGQPPTIQVFFAPPQPGDPDPIDQALLGLLQSAQVSVACAFYELELPAAADALIARHQAGVRVGIVSDSDYADRPAVRRCIEAGIPVVFDERPAFMHDKFCVVDGRFVWTGSTNITENCMYRNNNNSLLIDSAELAKDYAAEFGEMFDTRRFGPGSPENTPFPEVTLSDGTRVECYFAPEDDAGTALARFAESARERIDFAAFSFTSAELADAMAVRMQAGVRVRGVFEKRGANGTASKFKKLAGLGAVVRTDNNPASLHDKFLVVDSASVATGSFNFSRNADERNDENLLIVHNPEVARKYVGEVDRLMN